MKCNKGCLNQFIELFTKTDTCNGALSYLHNERGNDAASEDILVYWNYKRSKQKNWVSFPVLSFCLPVLWIFIRSS